MVGESRNFGINGSFGSAEKKFCISLSEPNTKFCLIFHYSANGSFLFVHGKEFFTFKANNEDVNFKAQFFHRVISYGQKYLMTKNNIN